MNPVIHFEMPAEESHRATQADVCIWHAPDPPRWQQEFRCPKISGRALDVPEIACN